MTGRLITMPTPDELANDAEYIDGDDAEAIEAAWSQEIARRVDQLVNGEVETISHEEVMARGTARLAALRAARGATRGE